MPIRVLMDNNVPDHYEALSAADQETFDVAFLSARCTLHVCGETLQEMLGIIDTERRDKLPGRVEWFLKIFNGRFLQEFGGIIRSELTGDTQPYVDNDLACEIREYLERIRQGDMPDNAVTLVEEIKADTASGYEFFKSKQAKFRDEVRGKKREKISLDDLLNREDVRSYEQRDVAEILRRMEIDDPERRAAQVMAGRGLYPFLDAFLKTHGTRFYRNIVQNLRVDKGDEVDAHLLTYMAGLDWLVTEDTGLRKFFPIIFPDGGKKVLSVKEFLEELGK